MYKTRACKIKSGVTKNAFSYLKKTPRESIFNLMSLRKQNEKGHTSRYKKCSWTTMLHSRLPVLQNRQTNEKNKLYALDMKVNKTLYNWDLGNQNQTKPWFLKFLKINIEINLSCFNFELMDFNLLSKHQILHAGTGQ